MHLICQTNFQLLFFSVPFFHCYTLRYFASFCDKHDLNLKCSIYFVSFIVIIDIYRYEFLQFVYVYFPLPVFYFSSVFIFICLYLNRLFPFHLLFPFSLVLKPYTVYFPLVFILDGCYNMQLSYIKSQCHFIIT